MKKYFTDTPISTATGCRSKKEGLQEGGDISKMRINHRQTGFAWSLKTVRTAEAIVLARADIHSDLRKTIDNIMVETDLTSCTIHNVIEIEIFSALSARWVPRMVPEQSQVYIVCNQIPSCLEAHFKTLVTLDKS